MRTYEPIWQNLKAEGECRVSCPAHMQARVIKAVKKEKWHDQDFKDVAIHARLEITQTPMHVHFKLYGWVPLVVLAKTAAESAAPSIKQ